MWIPVNILFLGALINLNFIVNSLTWQAIAKRGQYGAYLAEDWDSVEKIVKILAKNLSVPVTCKIRVFPDLKKSIQYAKMLERWVREIIYQYGRGRDPLQYWYQCLCTKFENYGKVLPNHPKVIDPVNF